MTNTNTVDATTDLAFTDLGLAPEVLKALADAGYEKPSPIQAQAIPTLLAGRDVLGLAQTGTGKTAAFALPALSTLTGGSSTPQMLVLAPTRELAIQVAESFEGYAKYRKDIRIMSIYGGQAYDTQIRALKRGDMRGCTCEEVVSINIDQYKNEHGKDPAKAKIINTVTYCDC